MAAKVISVETGSLAETYGIKPGDTIQEINGIIINDYLDFMYASCQEEIEIKLSDRSVSIYNEDYMPLGISFSTLLIDEPRSCHNKCVFCFIDQLPKGMRETCYFKDDDYRLSFLQGNYVTMTNMKDEDVERILRYNIPRINISVHTTNPELRKKMLNNKRAGSVLDYLKKFADGGMNLNTQIVLCPGYNDKEELDRTLKDLGELGYSMESISIVPVGLSNHREGLAELKGFDKESATEVIRQTEKWQKVFLEKWGTHLVYLADEFYIMAEEPMPEYEDYEGFPQIENGVGLCASLEYEFTEALAQKSKKKPKRKKTLAVGMVAYKFIKELIDKLDGDMISVIPIKNNFFGEKITVSGLITGKDLIDQLKGKDLGEELLISSSMLRHDDDVLLDDIKIKDIEKELSVRVRAVPADGYEMADMLLD